MKNAPLKYRPDIDGLRAIAVLAVVFFHLDYPFFNGGYIGVDVFFVISGFLISQIIYTKTLNNDFSFRHFYKKRILRILPVLLTLILVCLIAGFFILLSDEFFDLGVASIASTLFVPNVLYWLNTGYFEIEAEATPLLHLWSLGVEEQFYILFPLFAYLILTKLNKKQIFVITTSLIILSFYINVLYTSLDITFSFYMLFSRAWELLAGFFLTLILQHIKKINGHIIELISIVGCCLIIFPIYWFETNILFPGYYALLPVLGSMLIIFSGSFEKEPFVNKVLSHKYLVFIGLISYSLYLWHWPITVYLKMAFSHVYLNEIILVLSLLLSIITYLFVEKPFRGNGIYSLGLSTKLKSLLIMATLIITLSLCVIYTNGFPGRLPDAVIHASTSKDYLPENRHCHRMSSQDIKDKNFCTFGDPNAKPSFALFGDSHAEAFKYGLKLAAINKGKSGFQYTRPGCRPIIGIDKKGRKSCLRFTDLAIDEIIKNKEIKTVFLAGYWALAYRGYDHNRRKIEHFDYQQNNNYPESRDVLFLRGLHRTFELLVQHQKNIVVIEDNPVLSFNPRKTFARNIYLNKEQDLFGTVNEGVNDIIMNEIKVYGDAIKYMPIEKILCPESPCKLVKNNVLLFRDDDHITRKASALLTPIFEKYL